MVKQWNVISLGAGVQSSAMALMASRGELLDIKVDFAIFADTQDESKRVYDWLDWLEKQLTFPVYRVTKGKLSDHVLAVRKSKTSGLDYTGNQIPLYGIGEGGEDNYSRSRKCTADFKVAPIMKELRNRCGIKHGQKVQTVTSLIGISYDEMQRMKDSRDPWVVNRWPLVEMRQRRSDCIEWMRRRGYPEPPRSSCVYCPFHSDKEWRRLQTEEPDEFAKAVEFDRSLREINAKLENNSLRMTPYLHRARVPLDQIDFRSDVERGQQVFDFGDECDGMCGV
jgi:hypothetical protein